MSARVTAILCGCLTVHAAAAHAQQSPRVLVRYSGLQNEDEQPSPSGRFVARSAHKVFAIDNLATHQSSTIANVGAWEFSWSRNDDAIVFVRGDDAGDGEYVWYVAVDPSTGRARGTPRRVSVGQGEYPAVSSDGKWIAYAALEDSSRAVRLVVVPVNGGAERTLARFRTGIEALHWSADDQMIFLSGPAPDGSTDVIKVRVADGRTSTIGPRNVWLAGMTRDRRYVVTVPTSSPIRSTDRATVLDTSGVKVGELPLPVGSVNEYAGVIGDSALVWVDIKDRKALEIRPVNGGAARRIPLVGEADLYPKWAPDGKRLAFMVQDSGRFFLATVNADGTGTRTYRDAEVRLGAWAFDWSPRGDAIAYRTPDTHSIWLLDVATGRRTRLVQDTAFVPGGGMWRADGAALVYTARMPGPGRTGALFEVAPGGTPRRLQTLEGYTTVRLLGSGIYVRDDSTANVWSLDGTRRTRLGAVQKGTQLSAAGASSNAAFVVSRVADRDGTLRNEIEVTDVAAHTVRTFVPPVTLDWFSGLPAVSATRRSMFLFGRPRGDTTSKLYEIPLDGTTARTVVDVGYTPRENSVALSPDEKRIVYTVQPAPSEYTLLLLELPRAIRATSRSTRR